VHDQQLKGTPLGLPSHLPDDSILHTEKCNALQIQFYLALEAHQFVGHSVALPDALLIMERWQVGRYATYYNGGNIPLEAYMPLYQ